MIPPEKCESQVCTYKIIWVIIFEFACRDWLGGSESDKARQMLHTQYHEVEKFVSALTIKW